ncbi:MAG: hypothetical protein Q8R25_00840 [bacterium]|nr:hypothetical protein [bacterium]
MRVCAGKRPYFAHPINSYDTPLEHSLVEMIADFLSISVKNVENPNQPHHQIGYEEYGKRALLAETSHKGMNYFYDEVLPKCDSCIVLPFLDERMGFGTVGEVYWFLERGLPCFRLRVFEIPSICRLRHFEQNYRQSGLFIPWRVIDAEKEMVLKKDPRLVVSQEETRLRTWIRYQVKPMRPYEEAHLVKMPLPADFYPEKK